jgi:hypothetical protein
MCERTPRTQTLLRLPPSLATCAIAITGVGYVPERHNAGNATESVALIWPEEAPDHVLSAIWDSDWSARAILNGESAALTDLIAARLVELTNDGIAWSTLHDVAAGLPPWMTFKAHQLLRHSLDRVEAWAARAPALDIMQVFLTFSDPMLRARLAMCFSPMTSEAAQLMLTRMPLLAHVCLDSCEMDDAARTLLQRHLDC